MPPVDGVDCRHTLRAAVYRHVCVGVPVKRRPDGVEVYDGPNHEQRLQDLEARMDLAEAGIPEGCDRCDTLRAKLAGAEKALESMAYDVVSDCWCTQCEHGRIVAKALAAIRGTEPPVQSIMTDGGTEEAASGQICGERGVVGTRGESGECESRQGAARTPSSPERVAEHPSREVPSVIGLSGSNPDAHPDPGEFQRFGDTDARLADHGLLHREPLVPEGYECPCPTCVTARTDKMMMTCEHGIDHSGERHGCDGCCKYSQSETLPRNTEGRWGAFWESVKWAAAHAPTRIGYETSETATDAEDVSPPVTCEHKSIIHTRDYRGWCCVHCATRLSLIPRAELRQLVEVLRQARDTVMLVDDTTYLDNALALPCAKGVSDG